MAQISYKWWYITRDDDTGLITEAAVRFYEGDDFDVETVDSEGNKTVSKAYRRTKRLSKSDIPELDGAFRKESDGSDCRVYTREDFGDIKTDGELRVFVNRQMAKHKTRKPQKDQTETKDPSKAK